MYLQLLMAFASLSDHPSPPTISNIEYQITFTAALGSSRTLGIEMRFTVSAGGAVELSLPAWTPGAYEISNYARSLSEFRPTEGAAELRWDKTDYDTWRVQAAAAGTVVLRYQFLADTLDNAMAWAKPDFAFVNGTNVFMYPEGSDLSFASEVTVRTEPDWQVVTAMTGEGKNRYTASNYHDLVDMPFFIGKFDLDSVAVAGVSHRLASYPAGAFGPESRTTLLNQIKRFFPPMTKAFGDTPMKSYTTLIVFDQSLGGGSALEHQSSHLGIYNPGFMGTPILASITAHEMVHAWNVKRIRPAEMFPYRYDQPNLTRLLWVSEGITDYYADLVLVRGGVVDSARFLDLTMGKLREVGATPAVALEDASLSTWIHPTDGTGYVYYPKGSLAGLLLDVMIRDASDNAASLDDVFRSLYVTRYKAGQGFTEADWWDVIAKVSGKPSSELAEFATSYIDGRERFPYGRILPLAGIRYIADTIAEPRLGVTAAPGPGDGSVRMVTDVEPASAAEAAGILVGDQLVSIGDIKVVDDSWATTFRSRFRNRAGERLAIVVRRDGKQVNLTAEIRAVYRISERLEFDARASKKAIRIRTGLLKGTTDKR